MITKLVPPCPESIRISLKVVARQNMRTGTSQRLARKITLPSTSSCERASDVMVGQCRDAAWGAQTKPGQGKASTCNAGTSKISKVREPFVLHEPLAARGTRPTRTLRVTSAARAA